MNPVAEDILSYMSVDDDSDSLEHYGIKRRSGRYPWGSGDSPYQHSGDFLNRVQELKKEGFSEKEIVKALKFNDGEQMLDSTTQLRAAESIAKHERRRLMVDAAKSLADDGMGATEIGRELANRYGLKKPVAESTVRSYLNDKTETNMNAAMNTAEKLKEEIKTKHMIDVGAGVERELGVSSSKMQEALEMLQMEGYNLVGVTVPQVSNPKKRTTVKVLCEPGDYKTQQRELYQDNSKIKQVGEYTSKDGGKNWWQREYPASIDSSRIKIRYGDEGREGHTGANKDGVIEIRRGVKDLDLGNSHYAQVRIMVDGTHYLKGMAMYSDNMPDGVDIVFNTNKKKGTPMIQGKDGVLKPIKDDPDNPFGAYIKADGQSYYDDPKGKYTDPETGKKQSLSAINKLKEEGEWDTMSRNLSSQFLSKQPMDLINRQLKLTYADYESQFDDIMSCTNPTVKKKLLRDFGDECDSAVVHMKAASLPRQSTRVILPVTALKETECYAPYLKDGERVALIRYPHAGTFEIPELVVNNKNPSAKKILGNAIDAIGINSKTAEVLSGADFDGDTVVVIPLSSKVRIKSTANTKDPAFAGLKGFDPKDAYGTDHKVEKDRNGKEVDVYYNAAGIKVKPMSEAYKQKQMGVVSNLITDMTLAGAPPDEIVRAVRHSMVVIDAAKHHLDYRQSEKDNGIAELKKKYQPKYDEDGNLVGYGGARTLLSRRKQTVDVPERQGAQRIDPETGKPYYNESGREYTNKEGVRVKATTKTPLLTSVDDLRTLSSGTTQENAYADYGNKMLALGNRARKEYLRTPNLKYSPQAKKTYAQEVKELDDALDIAARNAPRERRAQALANSVVKAKIQDNPELAEKSNRKELEKVRRYALQDARNITGADGGEKRIKISDRQWEAIQAGAISDTKLTQILRYTDPDAVRERAIPRATTTLSTAKISKVRTMNNSGYTIAQIAEALGVSTSTVSKYLNQ